LSVFECKFFIVIVIVIVPFHVEDVRTSFDTQTDTQ